MVLIRTDTREALIARRRNTMSMPTSRVPKGCARTHAHTQAHVQQLFWLQGSGLATYRVHHHGVEAARCEFGFREVRQSVVNVLHTFGCGHVGGDRGMRGLSLLSSSDTFLGGFGTRV